MAQNLNYVSEGGNADNLIGSVCYNFNENYCDMYGRLYAREAALNITSLQYEQVDFYIQRPTHQGICPDGWHLPTDRELQTLYFLAANYDVNALMAINGGLSAECRGPAPHDFPVDCSGDSVFYINYRWSKATDALGFSLLAGGKGYVDDWGIAHFYNAGEAAYLWSIRDTEGRGTVHGTEFIGPTTQNISPKVDIGGDGQLGYSVRCIKN